ncbi:transcriptional regulator [Microbulbifer echini]|uniref:Transcriptional regulator n=1 Tax=Microbulbifer echini TaxID=1529067 RepID=A0ABV4NM95_9GAMM
MRMNAIKNAVNKVGTQARLAELLGVTQGMVSAWSTGRKKVAPHWCSQIERATDKTVTRYELRPDIFGEPVYTNTPVQATGGGNESPRNQ